MSRTVAILSVLACIVLGALGFWMLRASYAVAPDSDAPTMTAVLGGGCFWCTDSDFSHCPGVIDVVSGFCGGTTKNPTYENYHNGHHTECSLITYDPKKVTYAGLVEWLVKHTDPTDADGQFMDRGDGYRATVFYENEKQKVAAQKVFDAINAKWVYKSPIQIALRERTEFWPAEDAQQDYHVKSIERYKQYRKDSGRSKFIDEHWGNKADVLELHGSLPSGAISKSVVEKDAS